MIAITIFLVIGVDVMRILVFRLLLYSVHAFSISGSFPDRKTSDFVAKMLPIGFKSCVDFLLT